MIWDKFTLKAGWSAVTLPILQKEKRGPREGLAQPRQSARQEGMAEGQGLTRWW